MIIHGWKFSGLFLNSGFWVVRLKMLNSADNNSFSDSVSVYLKVFDHFTWNFKYFRGIQQVLNSDFLMFRILEILRYCKFRNICEGFIKRETSWMRSFVKIKPLWNGENTLSFTDVGNFLKWQICLLTLFAKIKFSPKFSNLTAPDDELMWQSWIFVKYEQMLDFNLKANHCDLYAMILWFLACICWRLFDI